MVDTCDNWASSLRQQVSSEEVETGWMLGDVSPRTRSRKLPWRSSSIQADMALEAVESGPSICGMERRPTIVTPSAVDSDPFSPANSRVRQSVQEPPSDPDVSTLDGCWDGTHHSPSSSKSRGLLTSSFSISEMRVLSSVIRSRLAWISLSVSEIRVGRTRSMATASAWESTTSWWRWFLCPAGLQLNVHKVINVNRVTWMLLQMAVNVAGEDDAVTQASKRREMCSLSVVL